MVVGPFPGAQLPDYLARVSWRGRSPRRLGAATQLAALADRFNLALDVGDVVRPRLGLECFFDRQPPDEPRWGALLDELVARGLAETLTLFRGQPVFVLVRTINYLKLLLHPDGSLEAKAYLGLSHVLVAPGRLRRPVSEARA